MNDDELLNLFNKIKEDIAAAVEVIEWAEDEIGAAISRHPEAADRIDRTFKLLDPTSNLLIKTDFVYRSHCHELLDRVVAGEDTRPGTAAECCVALSEVSLRIPFHAAAAGLYFRMWKLADLPSVDTMTESSVHYEAIEGDRIDEMETWLRNKLRQNWRVLER